jgi:hypothetical protein
MTSPFINLLKFDVASEWLVIFQVNDDLLIGGGF